LRVSDERIEFQIVRTAAARKEREPKVRLVARGTFYADSVALPVFARRTPLLQQLIDISYMPGPQQQTHRTLL